MPLANLIAKKKNVGVSIDEYKMHRGADIFTCIVKNTSWSPLWNLDFTCLCMYIMWHMRQGSNLHDRSFRMSHTSRSDRDAIVDRVKRLYTAFSLFCWVFLSQMQQTLSSCQLGNMEFSLRKLMSRYGSVYAQYFWILISLRKIKDNKSNGRLVLLMQLSAFGVLILPKRNVHLLHHYCNQQTHLVCMQVHLYISGTTKRLILSIV